MRKTKRPRGRMTAAEHEAWLKETGQHEVMMARARQQEEERQVRAAEWARAEVPLVEALRSVGLDVQSVWDLVNTAEPYPEAVPILLEHLHRPYPDRVREGIARALAVPDSRVGWKILLDQFRRDEDRTGLGAKYGVGCALAVAADDDVLDDVIALLRDPRHGQNRLALIDALTKSSNPKARKALMELGADPELAGEVQRALKRG